MCANAVKQSYSRGATSQIQTGTFTSWTPHVPHVVHRTAHHALRLLCPSPSDPLLSPHEQPVYTWGRAHASMRCIYCIYFFVKESTTEAQVSQLHSTLHCRCRVLGDDRVLLATMCQKCTAFKQESSNILEKLQHRSHIQNVLQSGIYPGVGGSNFKQQLRRTSSSSSLLGA